MKRSTGLIWIGITGGLLLFVSFPFSMVNGQISRIFKKDTINQAYYELNDTLNNNRLYVSQKLTSPAIINEDGTHKVRYRSNANTNLGIGSTYKWLTLNIGINFNFINDDDEIKGRTRFLDLRSTAFGRSYVVDLFGQFYKGVYLLPETGQVLSGEPYPQRGDIFTQQIGATFYYYPNWRKFSSSAAANQRDWQKKSAGSFMYGAEIFSGKIKGDSSLVPKERADYFDNYLVDKMKFFEIAAGGGYAYTLVIKQHWFVTASAIVSLSAGNRRQFTGEKVTGAGYVRPNFLIRPSFGYNSKKWNGSVMLFANRVNTGNNLGHYQIETYNLRFTLAYRMLPRNKHKKILNNILNLSPFWRNQEP
jgi:hypothetical protein